MGLNATHVAVNTPTFSPQSAPLPLSATTNPCRERITRYEGFDGFPMFSHDGRQLVFAPNRLGKVHGETNVFIADFEP